MAYHFSMAGGTARRQALHTILLYGVIIGALLLAAQAAMLRGILFGTAGWSMGFIGFVFLVSGILLGSRMHRGAKASIHRGAKAPLSERELEVLRGIALGQSNREIAANHFRSINTVKTQVAQIYQKLGVSGRVRAVDRARELGLLPLAGENHPDG